MGQKSEFPPPTFSPTLLLSWSLSLHPVVTNLSFILERKMKERKDNSLSDHATSHAFKIFCYITKQSVKLIDLTDLISQKKYVPKKDNNYHLCSLFVPENTNSKDLAYKPLF